MANNEELDIEWRKAPGQARARETVQAILTAGKILLQDEQPFSTSLIAQRAGVSIGSLYQYFPNKKAIAGKIYEAYLSDLYEQLEASVQASHAGPPELAIAAIIDDVFAMQRRKMVFRRNLKGMLSPAAIDALLTDAFTPKLSALISGFVKQLLPHQEQQKHEKIIFLLTTIIPHLIHETFARRPDYFLDQDFQNQVQCLILATIKGDD